MTPATVSAERNKDIARDRFSSAMDTAIILAPAGKKLPSPNPNIKRMTNNDTKDHANPVRLVKMVKLKTETISTILAPKRSAIQPPGICMIAYPKKKMLNIRPVEDALNWRSSDIWTIP
ncbi:Uncharacterised protein [Chlamydia trachomatis]|nr:Uncharacterised protein [Chlamydia trachomatis]